MEKIIINTEKKNNGHADFTEAFDVIRKHIYAEMVEVVKANDDDCQLCDIDLDEISIEHLGSILDKMHEVGFIK